MIAHMPELDTRRKVAVDYIIYKSFAYSKLSPHHILYALEHLLCNANSHVSPSDKSRGVQICACLPRTRKVNAYIEHTRKRIGGDAKVSQIVFTFSIE